MPSDSDKFTIKLHSLPSKFLSSPRRGRFSLSSGSSLLSRPRATLSAPRELLLFCGHMGTPSEEVGYSLAITITLCTPAPLCPPPPVTLPPSLFLLFRSSRPRLDSPFSLSFPLSLFSHRFFAMSFPLPSAPDHPVASTTAIPQLFSTFLALVAVAACRRISRAFRYYVLYWSFSPSLSFPFSRLFPSLFIPFFPLAARHPRLASISRAIAPSSALLRLLPPSALPFILEMDIGIHETKLMITTSKQRRTTNSYLSILLPASPLSPLTDPTCSPIFFSFSLVLLRSISSPFLRFLFLFRYVFHFYILLLECFSHSK